MGQRSSGPRLSTSRRLIGGLLMSTILLVMASVWLEVECTTTISATINLTSSNASEVDVPYGEDGFDCSKPYTNAFLVGVPTIIFCGCLYVCWDSIVRGFKSIGKKFIEGGY